MQLEDLTIDQFTLSQEDFCEIVTKWINDLRGGSSDKFELYSFDEDLSLLSFKRKGSDE